MAHRPIFVNACNIGLTKRMFCRLMYSKKTLVSKVKVDCVIINNSIKQKSHGCSQIAKLDSILYTVYSILGTNTRTHEDRFLAALIDLIRPFKFVVTFCAICPIVTCSSSGPNDIFSKISAATFAKGMGLVPGTEISMEVCNRAGEKAPVFNNASGKSGQLVALAAVPHDNCG